MVAEPLFPVCSFFPLPPDEAGLAQANELITAWKHDLGPVNRPFRSEAWALTVDGEPLSVAVSASTVPPSTAGLPGKELVELARLCSRPGEDWANRVALRLWRQVAGPRWRFDGDPAGPAASAAVSYSLNSRHDGRLYRFDGWEKITEDAGANCGPGAGWSKKRPAGHPAEGPKTLWLWRYPVGSGA